MDGGGRHASGMSAVEEAMGALQANLVSPPAVLRGFALANSWPQHRLSQAAIPLHVAAARVRSSQRAAMPGARPTLHVTRDAPAPRPQVREHRVRMSMAWSIKLLIDYDQLGQMSLIAW